MLPLAPKPVSCRYLEDHAGCYHCMTVFFPFYSFLGLQFWSPQDKAKLPLLLPYHNCSHLQLVKESMMWPERFILLTGQLFPLVFYLCDFPSLEGSLAAVALWIGILFGSRKKLVEQILASGADEPQHSSAHAVPAWSYLILFLFPFWCNCYTFQQPMEGTIGRKSSWISSASPNPAWICCLLPRDPAACLFLQLEKVRNFLRSGFCIQSLLHSHSQYKGKYSCSGYAGICTHLWTLKYVKESCVTPLNAKERAQWGKQKTEGSSEEKFSLAHCQFTKKYRSSAAAFHTTSTAHQFPFLLLPEFIYQTHVCIYIFAFPLVQLRVGPGKTADANIKLLTAASSSCTCKKGQHYPSLRMQAPHATSAGSKGIDLYHHHLV